MLSKIWDLLKERQKQEHSETLSHNLNIQAVYAENLSFISLGTSHLLSSNKQAKLKLHIIL